jgi:hypothetical protein
VEEEEEQEGSYSNGDSPGHDVDSSKNIQQNMIYATCPKCNAERKCDVLNEHTDIKESSSIDFFDSVFWQTKYMIIQCRGCEKIFFAHSLWFSENVDKNGDPIPTITYYPNRILRERAIPKQLQRAKSGPTDSMEPLILEIYAAVNANMPIVASMALRTLCDRILITKVGDNGGFSKNLECSVNAGHISASQRDIIQSALEVGHAAVHRGYCPTMEQTIMALDIVEGVAKQLLEHEQIAKTLAEKIPPRKKTPQK